ncbi:MAG TPA: HAD family hydrolase [Nitrosomonas nitrosa]|nr:HAD family hydrolase [Nitrosomonas nitrosa]
MRLRVIAVDYDGTIATDGILDPAVRKAIRQARNRGVLVVIVTGRILSELRYVAGSLDFVDGVVAENGAVVSLPNGHTMLLGQTPPVSLLKELTERCIDFKVGRCVVEIDANFSDVAITLIREMELPLAITFNRGRMMLLPASISKSCGLRELLNILGVSIRNAVGIGDAENDHELLNSCE